MSAAARHEKWLFYRLWCRKDVTAHTHNIMRTLLSIPFSAVLGDISGLPQRQHQLHALALDANTSSLSPGNVYTKGDVDHLFALSPGPSEITGTGTHPDHH
jgi:hypothetical protein